MAKKETKKAAKVAKKDAVAVVELNPVLPHIRDFKGASRVIKVR